MSDKTIRIHDSVYESAAAFVKQSFTYDSIEDFVNDLLVRFLELKDSEAANIKEDESIRKRLQELGYM